VFSSEELEKAKKLVAQFGQLNLKQDSNSNKEKNDKRSDKNKSPIDLLPSELLVIAGIICNVLQVQSVLVDRNQAIEIVLVGSLKRRTQLDKVMEQIGKMPFDQVMKSIMDGCAED
jgi:hypothetical protein